MAKSDATNVPGRNVTVTAASVFIEDESSLLAAAISRESWATATLTLLPF